MGPREKRPVRSQGPLRKWRHKKWVSFWWDSELPVEFPCSSERWWPCSSERWWYSELPVEFLCSSEFPGFLNLPSFFFVWFAMGRVWLRMSNDGILSSILLLCLICNGPGLGQVCDITHLWPGPRMRADLKSPSSPIFGHWLICCPKKGLWELAELTGEEELVWAQILEAIKILFPNSFSSLVLPVLLASSSSNFAGRDATKESPRISTSHLRCLRRRWGPISFP